MKKFFHNVIAILFYFATVGTLSLASAPVLGNLARHFLEPTGLWDSFWFLLPFVLVLCAVSGAWTLGVCRVYFKFAEWCSRHRGFGWVVVQSWA